MAVDLSKPSRDMPVRLALAEGDRLNLTASATKVGGRHTRAVVMEPCDTAGAAPGRPKKTSAWELPSANISSGAPNSYTPGIEEASTSMKPPVVCRPRLAGRRATLVG